METHNMSILKNPQPILKNNKLNLKDIKPISKNIIHSNPIYTGKINKKRIIIKFYKSKEVMQKELYCNTYLNGKGLLIPKIIYSESSGRSYIIMEMINGVVPSIKEINERVESLAKIHAESLKERGSIIKESLPKISKQNRLNNLKKYSEILKSNNLIGKNYFDNINILKKSISKTNYRFWDDCFCFNDFFVNNSLKSNRGVYYFDFEKTCMSNPFIDVGCIILDYPKEYKKIKEKYIKNICNKLKHSNFKTNVSNLSLLIDQGVCEKVIEDATFLSDNSIKKTKSNSFCKRAAKRKIENVSFIFNKLKKNLTEKK